MKSRPIGSWSHTWNRTSATSGIWMLKTRVSSHIGLNPKWHRKRYKQSTLLLQINAMCTCRHHCRPPPWFVVWNSPMGDQWSQPQQKGRWSGSEEAAKIGFQRWFAVSDATRCVQGTPLLCHPTWNLWALEAVVHWWSLILTESFSVLGEDPPRWG